MLASSTASAAAAASIPAGALARGGPTGKGATAPSTSPPEQPTTSTAAALLGMPGVAREGTREVAADAAVAGVLTRSNALGWPAFSNAEPPDSQGNADALLFLARAALVWPAHARVPVHGHTPPGHSRTLLRNMVHSSYYMTTLSSHSTNQPPHLLGLADARSRAPLRPARRPSTCFGAHRAASLVRRTALPPDWRHSTTPPRRVGPGSRARRRPIAPLPDLARARHTPVGARTRGAPARRPSSTAAVDPPPSCVVALRAALRVRGAPAAATLDFAISACRGGRAKLRGCRQRSGRVEWRCGCFNKRKDAARTDARGKGSAVREQPELAKVLERGGDTGRAVSERASQPGRGKDRMYVHRRVSRGLLTPLWLPSATSHFRPLDTVPSTPAAGASPARGGSAARSSSTVPATTSPAAAPSAPALAATTGAELLGPENELPALASAASLLAAGGPGADEQPGGSGATASTAVLNRLRKWG